MTDKILEHLQSRSESQTVTEWYANLQAVETFHLSPQDFAALHRWDKKALRYYLALKSYYEEKAAEEAREKVEDAGSTLKNAPQQKV